MQYKLEKRAGQFFFKDKKVIVDTLTVTDFYYEISGNKVEGKLRMGSKEIAIGQCEAVEPGWFLYGGVLRALPDAIDHQWIEMVYPFPKEIEDRQFFVTLEKELRGMPEVIWKERPQMPVIEALPYLVLKDRSGAFADLWMDYGQGHRVAMHDLQSFPWRSPQVEKNWEKDLLETGFIKKKVDHSHYYCPLDQVAKSLTFLIEIGWKVFDYRERQVYRQGVKDLRLEMVKEHIFLRGNIAYAEHKADVRQVLGAFNRREQFVTLSESAVGLIDPAHSWEELPEGEEGIKKCHLGSLEAFFNDPDIKKEGDLQELIAKVQRSPGIASMAIPPEFKGVLYPYQQEGLNWLYFLYQSGFSGLLADEMGLGKTVQILAMLSLLKLSQPILIVVPTSLLFNWKREFEKFLPAFSLYLHTGSKRLQEEDSLQEKQVIITSYALLRVDSLLLQSLNYSCIILDEAQMIKNPSSQIAKTTYRLKSPFRLAITGTPIENRWEDIESLFTFLMPELVCAQHLMKKKIQPFLLRRKKDQVALDLPEKLEQTVFVEMSERQQVLYDEMVVNTKKGVLKKIEEEGMSAHRIEILEALLRLRQICCHPQLIHVEAESGKFLRLFDDLEEVISSGRKVLVYSQFTTMLRLIEKGVQEKNWSYAYLDGSTRNREEVVEQFQNGSASLFLISLKAGGVGLNLTAADYVFLYDPWWNEAVEAQAIDRVHRHGRKSTVIAKRYITSSSIEEKMLHLKSYKTSLSRDLFNFEENPLNLQDLYDLLSSSIIS